MKKIIPVKKQLMQLLKESLAVANQDLKENALEMTMATLVFQPSELKFNITLYWWLFIFT